MPKTKPIKIRHVKQRHDHACSIACAAMITGKNYDELIKQFGCNFHKKGIDDETLLNFISDHGYAVLEKAVTRFNNVKTARKELFKSFAPVHLMKVRLNADSSLHHWVVMDGKGKFFCPLEWSQEAIRDCYRVVKVVGIYHE